MYESEGGDMTKANSGSDEAIKAGCTCPVLDNNHGRGAYTTKAGHPAFWYSGGCPIHTDTAEEMGEAT